MTKKAIIFFSIILISTGLSITGYFYWKSANQTISPLAGNYTSVNPDPLRPFSVLLLGYGGGKHDGGLLTDTIIDAYIEPRSHKVTLITIPRDLWVSIPEKENKIKNYKINAAYAIGSDDKNYPNKPAQYTGTNGGGEMAKKVVSDVTGLPSDYYVALSFAGFTKSIDILGGVDIKVARNFEDQFYPIDGKESDSCGASTDDQKTREATLSGDLLDQSYGCRYEDLKFTAGISHMDGVTALKYVRSRHSNQDGNDFNRSARQRELLVAVRDRMLSIGFIPKAISFFKTLTYDMQTDLNLNTLQQYLPYISEISKYSLSSIALTADPDNVLVASTSADRQFILAPKVHPENFDSVHLFIHKQLEATTSANTL
jgi:polyisoprenyl-teichoic acid--peptidoglycan teichoic acid transferase